jgi:SpoVK/Ycf46/Vps4 family AAA+-type ATPase
MALSTSVHDLRTLIRSCHPLIAIETVEEEQVLVLLQSVAAQERMPLFEWSITRGLTRYDEGRFDEIFFVDLPDDSERESIWKIHLGLRKQNVKQFDLIKIVSASDGFSGSDIEQAVVAALYRALHQKTPLTTDLLIEELTNTVPLSVTRREDIDQLRETAQGRFVNVR